MFEKIEKWFFRKYYAKTFRKEAYVHLLDAKLLQDQMDGDVEFYNASQKSLKEKQIKVEELKLKIAGLKGDAYTETREEIDTLNAEIATDIQRDKDFKEKLLPQSKQQISQKKMQAQHSLYKANIFKKIKIY